MCGRYVSASPPEELARYFGATPPAEALPVNYNVAPTDKVYAVRARDGHRAVEVLRWGLVPFWAKDVKIASKMINARSETVAEKPAFRRAFQAKRCLLPATGFYEWKTLEAVPGSKPRKQPYFIRRADGEPLVMAGLWERWYQKASDGSDLPGVEPLETCTVLTTAANSTMRPIHDRMPVFIPASDWDAWLDPGSDTTMLRRLLVPAPDELLSLHPVTTAVNNVRNRGPELLEPAEPEGSP